MDRVADPQAAHLHQLAAHRDGRPPGRHLGQARRMLEKYRVQLWAQQLGTAARFRADASAMLASAGC
jgi:ATP-dependent helicase HrpA